MIKIFNEDCKIGFKRLEDNSIDLIITDPPYGVGFSKGFDDSKDYVVNNITEWINNMYRVLKDNCHCYIFIPTKESGIWITEATKKFEIKNILSTKTYTTGTYLKNNFSFNNQLILYCSKGKAKNFNQVDFIKTSESWLKDKRNKNPKEYTYNYPSFLEMYSNEKGTRKSKDKGRHPCAKNSEFISNLIKISTNETETVLDCFMGCGSTGIACKKTNRKFIGFELNKEYFDIANKILKE